MQKLDVVKNILQNFAASNSNFNSGQNGVAWAPSNLALCKYWGKRDIELNLPVTSSLSVSLGGKGAFTQIKHHEELDDYYILNDEAIELNSDFAMRLKRFLDLFRPKNIKYFVKIKTNLPIAAGFASSACGFASLVKALDSLYEWRLDKKYLSILARLGSGSACRSIFDGFVQWQRGGRLDGMDSFAYRLDSVWSDLCIGAVIVSTQKKPISSSEAMQCTVSTSKFYSSWVNIVAKDLENIIHALDDKDFLLLGQTCESNALAMHATMGLATPSIIYSLPETIEAIAKVNELRAGGIPVFFTQDAGPNLQLLFQEEHRQEVSHAFPQVDIVYPFFDINRKNIILVDKDDIEIGSGEKIQVHVSGKLHRAFSVFIVRNKGKKIEVLLQQRSATKYHSANLWSNSCCGHPYVGEDIKIAAQRRLQEEMGVKVNLMELGVFHYTSEFLDVGLIENEVDHVFVGVCDFDKYCVNPCEVKDYCWIGINELQSELCNNPSKYTVWLPEALELFLSKTEKKF